ncbi:MAG: hypothetical protein CSA07_05135 [Bacteroidia bacterium]|nr:MAG: hypothetical protein CSA07_05135 [Bacteroidia bacterium]
MSVLVNFAMFPTDKVGSMSPYVAKLEKAIRDQGYPSQLTAMSTIVETPTLGDAFRVMQAAYDALAPDSKRVYVSATFDIKSEGANRLEAKVKSVEEKLARG